MRAGPSRDDLSRTDFNASRLEHVEAHFGLSRDAITGEGGADGAEAIERYEFAVKLYNFFSIATVINSKKYLTIYEGLRSVKRHLLRHGSREAIGATSRHGSGPHDSGIDLFGLPRNVSYVRSGLICV